MDAGSNLGWPCLDGTQVAAASACLAGVPATTVYANHPTWRAPLLVHASRPAVAGAAVYTGLAYPADYFGDVFYLLRDGARIYRIDLTPPCFVADPAGRAPLAFHDAPEDGDFDVFFDSSPVFKLEPTAEMKHTSAVAWFSGPEPLDSGWAWGQQYLDGGTAVAEATVGEGKVMLLGPEVTFRGQPHATFKLLFNGLYYGSATAAALP